MMTTISTAACHCGGFAAGFAAAARRTAARRAVSRYLPRYEAEDRLVAFSSVSLFRLFSE